MPKIFLLLVLLNYSCGFLEGSNDLGNNLYLSEGDTEEDSAIIICSSVKWATCAAGIPIIPTSDLHIEMDGTYAEYVQQAEADDRWIIAKLYKIKSDLERFWIIDKQFHVDPDNCRSMRCDSVVLAHVKGPFDLKTFNAAKKDLNVDLNF